MKRKVHSKDYGYIAERMNPYFKGSKVVIYYAEEQGIDTGGIKYAVVCDKHGTICSAPSIPKARELMKSVEFCEKCMNRTK